MIVYAQFVRLPIIAIQLHETAVLMHETFEQRYETAVGLFASVVRLCYNP